jgi:hypothetical protein
MPSSTKRIIEAGSCVPCEARVKYLAIQHNRLGINFSLYKNTTVVYGIRGKMRSTVWTVRDSIPVRQRLVIGKINPLCRLF